MRAETHHCDRFTERITHATLKSDLIIVKANIHLLRPEDGGKMIGIKSGYRPNHVFERPVDPKNIHAYNGDLVFDERDIIQPGQSKIVTVRFLRNPIVEKFMKVGQKWFICEGQRVVAEGEIVELMPLH